MDLRIRVRVKAFLLFSVFAAPLCGFALFLPLLADANADGSVESSDDSQQRVVLSERERAQIRSMGPWPMPVPADPGNEYSGIAWAEALGKQLFNDPGLSGDGQISCASCHLEQMAFSDGRSVALGEGKHVRNTQGLLDVGHQRWFGWDGGTDSLWAASIRPILSDVEMNGSITGIANYLRGNEDYPSFTVADDEQSFVTSAKLIASYIRTLESAPSPFDSFRIALENNDKSGIDEYPISAKRGLQIFFGEANCSACHFGPLFSNGEFHDTGRSFFTGVGQVDPGRYTGIKRLRQDRFNLVGEFNGRVSEAEQRKTVTVKLQEINWGQWRTPSLRNLTGTGPYLHDGSLATLREVVDAYADLDPSRLHSNGETILKPLDLDETGRNDLVNFLRSLSATP